MKDEKEIAVYERQLSLWNADQERWAKLAVNKDAFLWNLDGHTVPGDVSHCGQDRMVAVTYYGSNTIGSNAWKEASAVFMLEADYPRAGENLAEVSGWIGVHTMHEESVLSLDDGKKIDHARVNSYRDGRLRRSHGQLIPRGTCREIDENGVCAPMLAVCCLNDAGWLLDGWKDMFPGAPMPEEPDADSSTGSYRDRVKAFLRHQPAINEMIPATAIADHLGAKQWRTISAQIMNKKFRTETLPALGWKPENRRRGKVTETWFVRC